MPDILHEVAIFATPDKVFKALTEKRGIEGWWTPYAVAEPKVGSLVEAHFANDRFIVKMQVVALEPERKVEWNFQQGDPEWDGTNITWDITPTTKGSRLLFGHRGFASANGSMPATNYNWGFYITSLINYLEKGTGNPGGLDNRF